MTTTNRFFFPAFLKFCEKKNNGLSQCRKLQDLNKTRKGSLPDSCSRRNWATRRDFQKKVSSWSVAIRASFWSTSVGRRGNNQTLKPKFSFKDKKMCLGKHTHGSINYVTYGEWKEETRRKSVRKRRKRNKTETTP